jgi:hypothetical protein
MEAIPSLIYLLTLRAYEMPLTVEDEGRKSTGGTFNYLSQTSITTIWI